METNQNMVDVEKHKKTRSDEELVNKLRDQWAKPLRESRVRDELTFYEIQLILDGRHWMVIPDKDRSTSTSIRISPVRKRKGEIMRTYNKTRSLLRTLKANTTATEIRYEVQGSNQDEIMAGNYLNWYVDRDPTFSETVGDVVTLGFKRKTGYFYPHWDSQKMEPVVIACDPFDLLVDEYGKYALRTYTMRKEDLKNAKGADGPLFKDIEDVKTTSKQSASEIYNNYLSSKSPKQAGQNDMGDVMLEEYHIIEEKEVETEEGEASQGKTTSQTRIITTSEDSVKIHREDTYDEDELCFIAYQPERNAEPWLADALDPQRTLDNMYSHMEEFYRVLGKGRVMKRKGIKMDRISDRDGQVVEYDGPDSSRPTFENPGSIGGDQFNFFGLVSSAMEDAVGQHPDQVRKTETAKGIGYLMAQDQTNISEPWKNLKSSLIKLGHKLITLGNRHMMTSQEIFWWHQGQMQEAKIVGSGSPQTDLPQDVYHIKNPRALRVDLIPKGEFAALAREEKAMQLVQNGILTNPEVIMNLMNIGDIREAVDKEMAFRAEQAQNQMQMEATKTQIASNPPTTPGDEGLKSIVEDLRQDIIQR